MIDVIFYTDPLCCWSWGMEPSWRKFRNEYEGTANVQYKMAGLLPSWGVFQDTRNCITRPIQMGPEWMHARQLTGMPIDDSLWWKDPPHSSFPACIAVKAAGLQSGDLGQKMLGMLREAVMTEGRNIAKKGILLEVAARLAECEPGFDTELFRSDLFGPRGRSAFRADWQETKYFGITRLPTFMFREPGQRMIMLQGMQRFEDLQGAMKTLGTGVREMQE